MTKKNTEKQRETRPAEKRATTEYLKCDLTAEEVASAADQMSHAHKEAAELEDRKASIDADLKAQIKIAQGTLAHLANLVRTKAEYRDTACTEVHDWETKTVETFRDDTGAAIKKREMTAGELQMSLQETPEQETPEQVANAW